MKVTLNIVEQKALLAAFESMDARDVVVDVAGQNRIVRKPYSLGFHQRTVVRNARALRASLTAFHETEQALVKQHWPDLPNGKGLTQEDDPDGFARFNADLGPIMQKAEDIEMDALPEAVIYENEFPLALVSKLDQHGLIEG